MRRILATLTLAFLLCLAGAPALFAQEAQDNAAYAGTERDDGMDLGWLGLLGLAGLLGLKRREPVHRDVPRTTTTTTPVR
jgi:MYXO-CTERM domain-containing protein